MKDRVLVFVDALPWDERTRIAEAVPALQWARPVEPGFGYSVNVKSELFAGRSPDDAGFLNEWHYKPGAGWLRLPIPRIADRAFPGTSLHGRVVRKLMERAFGENVRNIPLHLLRHLGRRGVNAYEKEYDHPSLFTEAGIERFLYSEHGDDNGALAALLARLREANGPVRAFLGTAHLDHVMHAHGLGTTAYERAVEAACATLAEIWEILVQRGNDPQLALVSDHGMAAVNHSVSVDLEEIFAGAGRRYGYFVDATMMRVWCKDLALRKDIQEYIKEKNLPGRMLDEQVRKKWRIASNEFGDLIFLLDEGVMFAPSFMGRDACAAMHGYLPDLPSQRGILAATEALPVAVETDSVPALQIYNAFREWFGERVEVEANEKM